MIPTDRILGLTPLQAPDLDLALAIARAGGTAILDLGPQPRRQRSLLRRLQRSGLPCGLLLRSTEAPTLPAEIPFLVLAPGLDPRDWPDHDCLVQVRDETEAATAAQRGARGLVALGWEAGGRTGEETAFVLAQRLLARFELPLWVQGGFSALGIAACLAGGARGVVVDDLLALVRESGLSPAWRETLGRLDGSEIQAVDGQRGYRRPGREEPLLPVGAGIAFAAGLAERHPSAGALLRGLEDEALTALAAAAGSPPVREDNPLARAWGLRYPLAQGPMTRVSDGPEFAAAVQAAGGLPFLALALMRGPQARELLRQARERLGPRGWGVGILGFVPPELREEQLQVLTELRPPVVLIAGGRPSQARQLDDLGIETWLHVPSPGLLDLYLKEGARRFVFEGRESGGHIGPRGSLSLWEAQLQRLLRHPEPAELSVLLAGGIHDGRSAAMASAMLGPLAARGAKVGLLMGTAYLFTHEAVATGAIQPAFQEEALRCEATAVLETAPGHATRCAPTAFVGAFRAERERLVAAGRPAQEIWAALEELNLGRLRLAAKGLKREGERLVAVEEAEQRREGMYMLGQVAGLRWERLSIAALHEQVVRGAVERLSAQAGGQGVERAPAPRPVDIAIIGMACAFAGARDLEEFWSNVLSGACALAPVPPERWSARIFFDPESRGAAGGQTYCQVGGWLPPLRFDPLRFGIPPRSLVSIEPTQLLALEIARRALADAGYEDRPFARARTAVVFGAESGTELGGAYGFRTLYRQYIGELPKELDEVLPAFTEDSFPGVLANVIAGRIANRLDLGGPNYTVDAACASSLAALDAAVKELVSGGSDLAIAGGVDLHNGINDFVLFSSVHALSRRGECRVFDAEADGTIIGEGVAAVVLKRLPDARRDGDRIYAVIRGVGAASDGRSLGLTAPRREGQVQALRRAWEQAGEEPPAAGLIEAHGTGTVVGDRTELAALSEVFGGAPVRAIGLGSVKSQIGHTKCAAGFAGLIKAAMALHTGIRPPTIGVQRPNPGWDPAGSPFDLGLAPRPWPARERLAGVSAFGFGGTNFHVVLRGEPGPAPRSGRPRWPAELFLLRGADLEQARLGLRALAALLEREDLRLAELAQASCASGEGPVQVALVARDRAELGRFIQAALAGQSDPRGVFLRPPGGGLLEQGGRLAFLFPGQGSQRPGMLADLFLAFPSLGEVLELGAPWLSALYPPTAFSEEERQAQRAALTDTRVAQPALGIVELALARLLEELELRPRDLGGHSYGELVALCRAGAIAEDDLLPLSALRGRCILEAAGGEAGSMVAVAGPAAEVERLLADLPEVVLANRNAPDQVVLAGPELALRAAAERLRLAGLRTRAIPVAAAFHSPLIRAAGPAFQRALEQVELLPPELPVWSNLDARPHPPEGLAARLGRHLTEPVRFEEQIRAMYAAGVRVFLEVGPGGVCTRLVGSILAEEPHLALATDDGQDNGLQRLLLSLGALAVQGAGLRAERLFHGRVARRFELRRPPPPLERPSDWWVDGAFARPVEGELPAGAMRPVTEPLPGLRRAGAPVPPSESREELVLQYLEGMQQMVRAQTEVVLGLLGAAPRLEVVETTGRPAPPEARPALAASAPLAASTPRAAAAPPAPTPGPPASVLDALLGIVSERTGYPLEMLGPDLDLEADLSIDSIKRIEILGQLSERLELGTAGSQDRDALVEQLAPVRTLRGIVGWLEARAGASAGAGDVPGGMDPPAVEEAEDETPAPSFELRRYRLGEEELPALPTRAAGEVREVLLRPDRRGVGQALAELLRAQGARVRLADAQGAPENGEDLVDLSALDPEEGAEEPVERLFRWVKAIGREPRRLLVATGLGGRFGAPRARPEHVVGGPAGLLRTVARERAELSLRVVDLDPASSPGELARALAEELQALDGPVRADEVELGRSGGRRLRPSLEPVGLPPEERPLQLDPEAVVLITGGARGIAARCARALLERWPCRLVLVGRTPLPEGEEDAALAEAGDRRALRALLAARGGGGPREVEAQVERILAARELRANLHALAERAAGLRYEVVDVRDEAAFARCIQGVYAREGRLDGVLHAAGILEDRLIDQKTPESFRRVFDTKVAAARTLLRELRPGARFVVFFGSVAGVLGNRGQVDYAAANDALDKLARAANGIRAERVLSVDWGPWGGAGMVGPELEREYARRGIGLIDPEAGARALLDELVRGDPGEAQVLYICGRPEAIG